MQKIKALLKKPLILIILSAVLSALPLTFSFTFPVLFVSFVPLFYVLLKRSGDKLCYAFGRGFLFGFLYHICIYYWFLWFYPIDYAELSSGESVAVVLLAWIGISIIHGTLWCIVTVACHFAAKYTHSRALVCAVAIVGILTAQKLTAVSELAFPWARVSLGLYRAPVLIQSASLFGIDGVDVIVLLINALLTLCIIYPPQKRTLAAVLSGLIFISNLGFGLVRINNTESDNSVKIMTVQGSVETSEKWASGGISTCYNRYRDLIKENITDGVELVILPESCVPTTLNKNSKYYKNFKKLSKQLDTPLLVGTLWKEKGEKYNASLLIDASSNPQMYAKRTLVPFGEYMPYRSVLSRVLPFLENINVMNTDYTAGGDSALIDFDGQKLGNIICFESIYPNLCRESTKDGANILIEATNDSWLKDSVGVNQHLAHGVFRSVENSRYLIRSANSGVSAVIDSRGSIVSELGALKTGVITEEVHFSDETTLYTKTGDILYPILSVLTAVWFTALIILKKSVKA